MTLANPARDKRIADLNAAGWSQRRIAAEVGLTQPAISHALSRLNGQPRPRAAWDGPHPTGDPANGDPSKVIACSGGCGKLAWRSQRSTEYICADCRNCE
jgi:hypothetical protein